MPAEKLEQLLPAEVAQARAECVLLARRKISDSRVRVMSTSSGIKSHARTCSFTDASATCAAPGESLATSSRPSSFVNTRRD